MGQLDQSISKIVIHIMFDELSELPFNYLAFYDLGRCPRPLDPLLSTLDTPIYFKNIQEIPNLLKNIENQRTHNLEYFENVPTTGACVC